MKNLKDNTLLVVPSHLKEKILLSFCDELKNIKIMTDNEFIRSYYFDYNLETSIGKVGHRGLDGITFLIGKLTIARLSVSDENKSITKLGKLAESCFKLIL